jgi:hypothetical protein
MFKGMRAFVTVGAAALALVAPGVAHANPTKPYNQCHGLQFKASLNGRPPGTVANPVSVNQADINALTTAGDADCAAIDGVDASLTSSGGLVGQFDLATCAKGKVHSIGTPVDPSGTHITGTNAYGNIWEDHIVAYCRDVDHPKHGVAKEWVVDLTPDFLDGFPAIDINVVSGPVTTTY